MSRTATSGLNVAASVSAVTPSRRRLHDVPGFLERCPQHRPAVVVVFDEHDLPRRQRQRRRVLDGHRLPVRGDARRNVTVNRLPCGVTAS